MEIPVPGTEASPDEVCYYLRFAPPDVVLDWLASPPGHRHRVTARRIAEALALVRCGVPADQAWAAACALHQEVGAVRARLLAAGVRDEVARFAADMADSHLPRLQAASWQSTPKLGPGDEVAKTITGGGRQDGGWSADDIPSIAVQVDYEVDEDEIVAFWPGSSGDSRSLGLGTVSPPLGAGGGGNSTPAVAYKKK